jgi:hypothetical protein
MAAEWVCDGCGKREPGIPTQGGGWKKPHEWYERNLSVKEDGTEAAGMFGPRGPESGTFKTILTACSRACIDRVAAKTATHSLVMPI